MKRRLLLGSATALIGVPLARADNRPASRRIGLLTIGSDLPMVLGPMAEMGIVPGRDVLVESKSAEGRPERLTGLAAELAALRPTLIVTSGPQATRAALAADPDVAVIALLGSALEGGLVAQLNRPGGRLTGVNFQGTPLNAKRLELLAELLPRGSRVLNLGDAGARTAEGDELLAAAAKRLGIVTQDTYVNSPAAIDAAFDKSASLRVRGVNVLGSPLLNTHRARIVTLAERAKLPTIFQWPRTAREGGLMGYGAGLETLYRMLAGQVVRVLQGARAGDLPIEQPSRFELVINLRTARSLGLTVPQALLLRADEVIG